MDTIIYIIIFISALLGAVALNFRLILSRVSSFKNDKFVDDFLKPEIKNKKEKD
jgi:hypothetical protein